MRAPSSQEAAARRLEEALELFEAGVCLMRENLRRRMPTATEEAIERALDEWLTERRP